MAVDPIYWIAIRSDSGQSVQGSITDIDIAAVYENHSGVDIVAPQGERGDKATVYARIN